VGRLDNDVRATDVDPFVALPADFAIDPRAMGDGCAALERSRQEGWVGEIPGDEANMRVPANGFVPSIGAARDEDHLVPLRREPPGEMPTHEAGATGDRDLHARALRATPRRRAIWVGHTALKKSPSTLASRSGSSR